MTTGSGVSRIASETTLVSMTIMRARSFPAHSPLIPRSFEVGQRSHRAAFGDLEIDAAKGGEAGMDGPAEILRW